MDRNKVFWAILLSLVSEGIFGFSFIFIKTNLETVSVFTLLSWRWMTAFLGMTVCVVLGFVKVNFRGKNLKPLIMLSLFQPVLYFTFETMGLSMTTASEGGTILTGLPIITMMFSAVFLKDRPTGKQILFMMITVTGGVMIGAMNGITSSHNLMGYLLLLLAMCSDSAYGITSQSLKEFNSAEKTYAMTISGAAAFSLFALIEHGMDGTVSELLLLPFVNRSFLFCVLYLGLGCSLTGYFMVNYSISIIGATRRASFIGIATVMAVLGGVLYLGESFSLVQGIATVMIIAGAYGVNKFARNNEE